MNALGDELARVGITGRRARRIELELDDHARCDPGAQLGSPQLIAERFAQELRLPETRRAVHAGFAALAATACGLAAFGLYPLPRLDGPSGAVVALAGLGIVLGAQVAFVGGSLALWGLHRGTQLGVVQRRIAVALAAGTVVLVGEGVDLVAVRSVAWWYVAALLPSLGLVRSALGVRSAHALTRPADGAGVAFTRPAVLAIGAGAALLVAGGSTFAERSVVEGLTRGAFEAVAFATCFVALGRRLGIRR